MQKYLSYHHPLHLRSSILCLSLLCFHLNAASLLQLFHDLCPVRGTSHPADQHAASPRPPLHHTRHRLRSDIERLQPADSVRLPRRPGPRHHLQRRLHQGRPVVGLYRPRCSGARLRPYKWPDPHRGRLGRRPRARLQLVHHVRAGRRGPQGRARRRHRQQRKFFRFVQNFH